MIRIMNAATYLLKKNNLTTNIIDLDIFLEALNYVNIKEEYLKIFLKEFNFNKKEESLSLDALYKNKEINNKVQIDINLQKKLFNLGISPLSEITIEVNHTQSKPNTISKNYTEDENLNRSTKYWNKEIIKFKQYLKSDKNIIGKSHVIEKISDTLRFGIRNKSRKENKPLSTFLFIGEKATGKSFIANKISNFSKNYKIKTIEMSNLSSSNSYFYLNGLQKGYSNAKPGELTEYVLKNPFSIIIFDNIDLAHKNSQQILIEIIETGYLKDQFGFYKNNDPKLEEISDSRVDFRNSILVFTTQMGKSFYQNNQLLTSISKENEFYEEVLLNAIYKEAKSQDIESNSKESSFNLLLLDKLKSATSILFLPLEYNTIINILMEKIRIYLIDIKNNYNLEINFTENDLKNISSLLSLSMGGDFSPSQIFHQIPFSFIDLIEDELETNENINIIDLKVKKEAIAYLKEIYKLADETSVLKYLKRRREYFKLDIKINSEEKLLSVVINKPDLKKFKSPSVFGSQNGFVIDSPEIKFDDIAGHDYVKERLKEIAHLLKNKNPEIEQYIPKGILLHGEPGTGKTMLAKALAYETDFPFIATSGQELLSEKAISTTFSRAREYAPSIVFIDEIDVFRKRGNGHNTDILVNKLLIEIDGFNNDNKERVFIIAATNLKNLIDPALLRSGRIDIDVKVPFLDPTARRYFLKKMLNIDLFDKNISVNKIVKLTSGLSGADLKKLEREVILESKRTNCRIEEEMLINKLFFIKYGNKLPLDIDIFSKRIAYHEAGHLISSLVLFPNIKIDYAAVDFRTNSLGIIESTFPIATDLISTKEVFYKKIAILLSGRISEIIYFGEDNYSNGAKNDLEQATQIAYDMITKLGMGSSHNFVSIEQLNTYAHKNINTIFYKNFIEEEIALISDISEKISKEILLKNWITLEKCVDLFLEKEFLLEKDISLLRNLLNE